MIDLNCGALTELAHAVLPAMIAAQVGRDPQRRLDRRLPAGPRHGGLFRDQGVRPVLHRGAARGSAARTASRVTALCPGPTATEFGEVAGLGGNAMIDKLSRAARPTWSRAGLAALDKSKAVAIPGLVNKAGAQGHRLLPRWLLRKVTGAIKSDSASSIRTCDFALAI